jgi:ATP-binding cassette subfamily B protein
LTIAVASSTLVHAATALAFIVLTGATVGAVPEAVRDGFDSSAGRHVMALVALTGGIVVLQHAWAPVHGALVADLGRRVDLHLRERVMRASFRPVGIGHLESTAIRDLVRDAGGVGEGQLTPGSAVAGLVDAASYRLTSIQAAVIVATYRLWLGIGLLVVGVLIRYRVSRDTLRTVDVATGRTGELRRADYVRDLAVTPPAAKELRVFGLASWMLERFRDQWFGAMEAVWRDRKHRNAASWSWSIPWGVMAGIGLVLVGRSAAAGDISLSYMAVLAQAVLTASSVYLGPMDAQMAYGAAAVPAVLELERAVASDVVPSAGRRSIPNLAEADIVFEGVSFRYPGMDHDVLVGLNLVIPAGRSLAVVGANGTGKTTLVKLLARLYEPTHGRITCGGVDLTELDPRAWQRRIAAIFQDFLRYELPAHTNIGLGAVDQQHNLDAIAEAAELVGARAAIEALPAQWATVLSREYADGGELSGGEWQRIALARALFALTGGAQVLVLDEPTANLDVRAEAALFGRFIEITGGATTILISHRFSSVRRADQICVLHDGSIAEQGSHEALMRASGHYARMFELQAARFADHGARERL